MVITLIGYRGTGKSTVAEQLAARLNWEMVDSDDEIELRAGKSIQEIFAQDGEPHFRDLERGVLTELLHRDKIVVSAGGGAILDDLTRQRMRQAGPVVWLQASVATIEQRIGSDPSSSSRRPALQGSDAQSEVATILAQREPLYSDAATMFVLTDDRDVTAIVDEIVSQLPAEESHDS